MVLNTPPNEVSINKNKKDNQPGLIDFITQNDALVVFGSVILMILLVIILTGLFIAGPVVRDNLFYNIGGMFLLGCLFVYLIFKFMDHKIIIFGKAFDFGVIFYIFIVVFICFVLAN